MDSNQAITQIYQQFGTELFDQNWVAYDWTLRDMVGYPAAGTNLLQFFAVPAGQNDPNLGVPKKREQANFQTQNQIGGDYFFIATHLRFHVLNSAKARQLGTAVATDTLFSARQLAYTRFLSNLTQQGVMSWIVNQKTILQENQPFLRFASGIGLGEVLPPAVGFTDGTPAAVTGGGNAYSSVSNYDIDGGGMGDPFSLAQPVVLAPSTTFEIDLTYPLGNSPAATNIYGTGADQTATVWLACFISGQKVRPRS